MIGTRKPSHDERRHSTPSFVSSQWSGSLPDDDGVGATSLTFSSYDIRRISGGRFPGRRRGGRPTKRLTTTTTSPAPRVSADGCKLVLYASTYHRGQTVKITGDVTDLDSLNFSDKLASLKVEGSCRWKIFQGESRITSNKNLTRPTVLHCQAPYTRL